MYPSFRQLTNRTNLPNFSFIRIRDLLFQFHLFLFSFFFSFFALYDDQRFATIIESSQERGALSSYSNVVLIRERVKVREIAACY